MATTFHELAVAGIEALTDDAVAITFAVPQELAGEYAFRPGQSLTVRRASGEADERRSYSICAPVGAPPRVGVREVPGGLVSAWLVRELRVGDRVEVLPPAGLFHADVEQPARHVLIAAGSGITPMISIAASALAGNDASTVTLLYGNRRSDTVMFADELAELKDAHPTRFEIVHVLSRESRESDLLSGRLDPARLTALLDALVPAGEVDHWWLCGPYEMVEGARDLLRGRGVPAERIHRELFYVEDIAPEPARHAEARPPGDSAQVTIILDGRSSTLALPRDVPILDAAQRVRGDLPFACKGGVCGTCRAHVSDGEVRMRRNFALEDDEVAAGFALTCQALPVSDAVTVDYDA